MSKWVEQAILARERRTRGEPEEGSFRELQEVAKDLGIPANQSKKDLEKAIEKKRQAGLDGAAGE